MQMEVFNLRVLANWVIIPQFVEKLQGGLESTKQFESVELF